MRTEGFQRNPQLDGPTCISCSLNPRRIRRSLRTLAVVFTMGVAAFLISYFFQDREQEMSLKNLDGRLDPSLFHKFELVDFQLNGLIKKVGDIETLIHNFKAVGGPKEDTVLGIVKNELSIYDADKTGITDYAHENLGACIISTKNTISQVDESSAFSVFGIKLWTVYSNPRAMIRPSMQPGECWAFKGRGEAIIELMSEVFVNGISIEHISPSLSPTGDISSAPKNFDLYGLSSPDSDKNHDFGNFEYSDKGPMLQMFQVKNPASRPFRYVEVHFNSNHGNKDYTCVYRIRIHGKLPEKKDPC